MALLINRNQQRSAGGVAPDLAAALARIDREMVASVTDPTSVTAHRTRFDEYADRIVPLAERPKTSVQNLTLGGDPAVPVRTYQGSQSRSVIVFVHGGGWIMGSVETHDHICRWLAVSTESFVVSVEYGLSPEHPFPHAVNQVAAVIREIQADRRLNQDLPVFVAGDSAGATIASMAILALTAEAREDLAGLISIHGVYAPQVNLSSHKLFADGTYGLSRQQMLFFWNLYAPHIEPAARQQITPLGHKIDHFPPTLCIGAEYDLLLDDTLSFYGALASVGADVTLSLWPGLTHGCLHFVERVDSVTAAAQSIVQYIEARRSPHAEATLSRLAQLLEDTNERRPIQLPMLGDVQKLVFEKVPLVSTPHLLSRSRLHGSVTHKLGSEIVAGRHKQGALIPTEEEIRPAVNVSRNAYREAVRTLAAKGLVAATPKVGTKVAARGSWRLLDPEVLAWHFEAAMSDSFLRDLYELRKLVEPSAAALAAVRMSSESRAALAEALAKMTSAPVHGIEWNHAMLAFHRLILQGGSNELVGALWPSFEVALQWQANLGAMREEAAGVHDLVADYAMVFDRLATKDAEGAMIQMAYLIDGALADTFAILKQLQSPTPADEQPQEKHQDA